MTASLRLDYENLEEETECFKRTPFKRVFRKKERIKLLLFSKTWKKTSKLNVNLQNNALLKELNRAKLEWNTIRSGPNPPLYSPTFKTVNPPQNMG